MVYVSVLIYVSVNCFYQYVYTKIGDVSEQDLVQCTSLDDGKIGIMDLIVDRDTFLAIDSDKYEYEISEDAANPIQVSYINPDIKEKQIQCFVNINWAKIGDQILHSSMTDVDSSSDAMIIYKVLIIVCIILLLTLICERIYFYHRQQHKNKYYSVNDDDAELSLS